MVWGKSVESMELDGNHLPFLYTGQELIQLWCHTWPSETLFALIVICVTWELLWGYTLLKSESWPVSFKQNLHNSSTSCY